MSNNKQAWTGQLDLSVFNNGKKSSENAATIFTLEYYIRVIYRPFRLWRFGERIRHRCLQQCYRRQEL